MGFVAGKEGLALVLDGGGEFLFQISAGLGDHILVRDAFMAARLDFFHESADGEEALVEKSGMKGRGEFITRCVVNWSYRWELATHCVAFLVGLFRFSTQ